MKRLAVITLILLSMLSFASCRQKVRNYNVFFESNGGSYISQIVTDGNSSITLPNNPTREGYIFDAWYLDNENFTQVFTADYFEDNPIHRDITLYANWVLDNNIEQANDLITITFITNADNEIEPLHALSGIDITEPEAPTRAGFIFRGWYQDENLSIPYEFERMPATNVTIYARWEQDLINGGSNN